jgi:MFS family permease
VTGAFGFRFVSPLLIGTLLNPINSAMIATALVPIGRALHAGPSSTAWLVAALYLAAAVGQPTMGRIADLYGPRKVSVAGLALVLAAGLTGALAPGLGWLIVSRVLLGLGTSAAYPAAMTMIRARAEETGTATPGTVLGLIAITGQVSAAVGPALGGGLVGLAGWRSIFLVNVPLAALGIVLGLWWLPRDRRGRGGGGSGLDLPGVALFAVGLTALLLFLMRPHTTYALLGGAVASFAALVWWELRRGEPFIDMRILVSNRALTMTYVRYALTWLVIYSVIYGFSQWLEEGRGLGPLATGLVTLPSPIVGTVAAAVVSRRERVRGPLLAATTAMIAGSLALTLLRASSPIVLLVAVNAVTGLPQGLSPVPNQAALYRQASADRIGSAAGLLRTSQYVGAILQSTLVGVVYGSSAGDASLRHLAVVLTALAAVVLLITIADPGLRAADRR